METRWYFPFGQSVENTRISDRTLALHITKSKWNGIERHLDRNKRHQEKIDQHIALNKYLDEGSKNMTKDWENTIEKTYQRKKEEREKLIQKGHEDIRKERLRKEAIGEKFRAKNLKKINKQLFMSSGHAKDLTKALVVSEVLYERQMQIELQKRIKQHENEEEQKYFEMQQEKANKEAAEDAETKKKLMEKNAKYCAELKKMIEERAASEKTMRDQRIENEKSDNMAAAEKIEKLNTLLREDKLRKKKELFEEKKKNLIIQKEQEQQKINEDKELDEVVQLYSEAKHRIECLKKQRLEDIRKEAVKRREKIAAMVMVEQMDRSAAEEKVIREAIAERDAAEAEKVRARKEFDEQAIQARLKNREEELALQAARKSKEEELKKWELLNLYKTHEVAKEFENNRKKQMWQEVLKYRQELIGQMEYDKLKQMKEKEMNDEFARTCIQRDDATFFDYANEVLQQAKQKGRSTLPIERVIAKYAEEMHINTETQGEDSNDSQADRSLSDLKKKLLKPRKPRRCRCHCEKS